MCLSKKMPRITKKYMNSKSIIEAYKIVEKHEKIDSEPVFHSVFSYLFGDDFVYQKGENIAYKKEVVFKPGWTDQNPDEKYDSGFHCFLDIKDAKKEIFYYRKDFTDGSCDFVLIKVKINPNDIICIGKEGSHSKKDITVIVSKKMTIDSFDSYE